VASLKQLQVAPVSKTVGEVEAPVSTATPAESAPLIETPTVPVESATQSDAS